MEFLPLVVGLIHLKNGVIANTIANTTGFWAPYFSGLIFDTFGHTNESWSYVFYISAGIGCLTGTIYIIFFSTDEDEWSKNRKTSENYKMLKK